MLSWQKVVTCSLDSQAAMFKMKVQWMEHQLDAAATQRLHVILMCVVARLHNKLLIVKTDLNSYDLNNATGWF